jgi:hypothetical protein
MPNELSNKKRLELVGDESQKKAANVYQADEASKTSMYDGDIEHLIDISIDFFQMLDLSRELTNDEISKELRRLELTWGRRKDQAATEAAKNNALNQLEIIRQAKLAFACDESREDYVNKLDLYKRKELEIQEQEREIAERNQGLSVDDLKALIDQQVKEKTSSVSERKRKASLNAIQTEYSRNNYEAAIDYCVKALFDFEDETIYEYWEKSCAAMHKYENGYTAMKKYAEAFPNPKTYQYIIQTIFQSEDCYKFDWAIPYIEKLTQDDNTTIKIAVLKHVLETCSYGAHYFTILMEQLIGDRINETQIEMSKLDLLFINRRLNQDKKFKDYWNFMTKIETYFNIHKNAQEYEVFVKDCADLSEDMLMLLPFATLSDVKAYLDYCNNFNRIFTAAKAAMSIISHFSQEAENVFLKRVEIFFIMLDRVKAAKLYIDNFSKADFMFDYFKKCVSGGLSDIINGNNLNALSFHERDLDYKMRSAYSLLNDVYKNQGWDFRIFEIIDHCILDNLNHHGTLIFDNWLSIYPDLSESSWLSKGIVDHLNKNLNNCDFICTFFDKYIGRISRIKDLFLPLLLNNLNGYFVSMQQVVSDYVDNKRGETRSSNKIIIPSLKRYQEYTKLVSHFKAYYSDQEGFQQHIKNLEYLDRDVECYRRKELRRRNADDSKFDLAYYKNKYGRFLYGLLNIVIFPFALISLFSVVLPVLFIFEIASPIMEGVDDFSLVMNDHPLIGIIAYSILSAFSYYFLSIAYSKKYRQMTLNPSDIKTVKQYELDLHMYCGESILSLIGQRSVRTGG